MITGVQKLRKLPKSGWISLSQIFYRILAAYPKAMQVFMILAILTKGICGVDNRSQNDVHPPKAYGNTAVEWLAEGKTRNVEV